MDRVKYTRIFTDDQWESHAEDVELALKATDFAPRRLP